MKKPEPICFSSVVIGDPQTSLKLPKELSELQQISDRSRKQKCWVCHRLLKNPPTTQPKIRKHKTTKQTSPTTCRSAELFSQVTLGNIDSYEGSLASSSHSTKNIVSDCRTKENRSSCISEKIWVWLEMRDTTPKQSLFCCKERFLGWTGQKASM